MPTIPDWPEIHRMEIAEEYPAAIDALEARLAADLNDREAVIRLGFNLWYAVVEDMRMQKQLPVDEYAERFMALFNRYRDSLSDSADFCWAFGLGISMDWYYFPGATEEMGRDLLDRAKRLDEFYRRDMPEEQMRERFRDRGIFASYYNVQG